MSTDIAFYMLGSAILVGGAYGWRHYHTPLNPLTVTSFIRVGLFTLVSGLVAYFTIEIAPYPPEALAQTALIALVSYFGFTIPYFFRRAWLLEVYGRIIKLLGLGSNQIARQLNPFKFIVLLIGVVVSFVALAMIGGGGLLWITDIRTAYIQNRAGAGPFFAGMQWFLVSALLYYLWARRPQGLHLMFLLGIFAALAYFSGSKNNILTIGVIGIVYYNYCIRPISLIGYVVLLPSFLLGIASLLIMQGAEISIFIYFKDYFNTTAWFLSRFDEFVFQYGHAWLSSLWFYVPRALYADKPYEYGVTLIHQVLFPNMAETGNTPGILGWATSYLDFGIAGVFASGFWGGIWQRAAYEHFLNHRQSFFAFLFMMQFALWAPLPFATPLITVVLALGLSLYFRLVLGHRKKPSCLMAKPDSFQLA